MEDPTVADATKCHDKTGEHDHQRTRKAAKPKPVRIKVGLSERHPNPQRVAAAPHEIARNKHRPHARLASLISVMNPCLLRKRMLSLKLQRVSKQSPKIWEE
jgi:hypothetical protein